MACTGLSLGGSLLAWAQVCDTKSPNSAGVLRSTDGGDTWKAYGELLLPEPMAHWVIEGSIVELINGSVMIILRSTEGFLYRSLSMDQGGRAAAAWEAPPALGAPEDCLPTRSRAFLLQPPGEGLTRYRCAGITWGQVSAMKIRNPDAKAHATRLQGPEFNLMLAYNNHDRPFHGMAKGRTSVSGKQRDTLMLAVSSNSGISWRQVRQLAAAAHPPGPLARQHPPWLRTCGDAEGQRICFDERTDGGDVGRHGSGSDDRPAAPAACPTRWHDWTRPST